MEDHPAPPKRGPGRPRKPPPPDPAVGAPLAERVRARGALSSVVADDLRELGAQQAGLRVYQWLSKREFALWPSLCAELASEQKVALCLHLLLSGISAVTIANQCGFMPNFVKDIWRDWTTKLGEEILGVTLPGLVGRIESRAEQLVEMAVNDNRPDRAWKIEKERVEILQDLGVVERAAKRFEVAHQHTLKAEDSADAETQAEVNRILELERKRRESGERVKRINARVMDALPEQITQPPEDEDG